MDIKKYRTIASEYVSDAVGNVADTVWNNKWVRRTTYGVASSIVLICTFWIFVAFNILGFNTQRDGWQAGTLANYTVGNSIGTWLPFSFFPVGEGYLLLGSDSSRNITVHGYTISPAHFSSSADAYEKYNNLASKSVVMHFRELRHSWTIGGETNIRSDIFQKTVEAALPASCSSKSHGTFTKKSGVMGGKVVETARVGSSFWFKTHEVVIHTGGNEFKEMSITDSDVYDCAIIALKSGKSIRIEYDLDMIRDPITQATLFNIIGFSEAE